MSEIKATLAEIIADMRRRPKTVEEELALHDFMELSHNEQMEVLFVGLCQVATSANWSVAVLMAINGNKDG